MVWSRLDDGFFDHPKAIAAGKDGRELFLASVCHAAKNLTDGFVSTEALPLLVAKAQVKPAAARALVELGWWHVVPGGWEIHDFLDFNPSAEQVKADRVAAKERQKKWRESRRDNKRSNAVSSPSPYPDPARPEGSRAGVSEEPSANEPPAPAADGGAGFEDRFHDEEQVQLNVERARAAHQALKAKAS